MLRLSEGRRKARFHYAEREQLRQSQRRPRKPNNVLDWLTFSLCVRSLRSGFSAKVSFAGEPRKLLPSFYNNCCLPNIRQTAVIFDYFLISLTNHSSSGWNPKKVFPSPPKSQGLITSKDLKGRRWSFPCCNNTCSLRRNLRLLACFPFFCDLQQHHVLPGIRFLLLLIVS